MVWLGLDALQELCFLSDCLSLAVEIILSSVFLPRLTVTLGALSSEPSAAVSCQSFEGPDSSVWVVGTLASPDLSWALDSLDGSLSS